MVETFLEHLRGHLGKTEDAFRQKGWQKFVEMGLPTKANDAFRYVPLRELYAASFHSSQTSQLDKSVFAAQIFPECANSHIVFVDGVFCPHLSDLSALSPQVVLLSLDDAMRSHASFLQSNLSRSLKDEKDPFALLNLALHKQGAFFYLPPKIEEKTPVQILHVITGSSQIVAPRIYLTLGAKSQLSCISSSHCIEGAHFVLPVTELALEEDALLKWLSISDQIGQSWQMESVRATLKKNARLETFGVTTGAKAVRQNVRVQLKGENSEATLNGLWLLDKNRTAHFHTTVEHEAPHTRSMQMFKGVLKDAAQSSFEGKI
ncbi:MAG: SufD family Fe-S cluster assembly protein, partial [Candidatus Melainabacteria bacterium]|nr:SufD family Fe-S cluster assembly protein [Candidatus Melainabacteria bacterium]